MASSSSSAATDLKELGDELSVELKGTSLAVVGDDSEANSAVVKALASALGYTPFVTEETIEKLIGMTVTELIDSEGLGGLGGVEAVVVRELSTQVRTCVATAGRGGGAAARGDCWPFLFGFISIWIDDGTGEAEDAPQRGAYGQSEIHLKVSDTIKWDEETAADVANQALQGVKKYVDSDQHLCGKKSLYIRLGCRGDWPDLKPPNWKPEDDRAEEPIA